MDNTIIDELGFSLRPGIVEFLEYLSNKYHLVLWTNSKKVRAYEIIKYLNIRSYFDDIITREDYDPNEDGFQKNISARGIKIFIDDDPKEIAFVNKNKSKGILVKSYRKGMKMDSNEFSDIIKKGQRVLYVTERCVFELTHGELKLKEIFDGINPATQIYPLLDYSL